MHFYPRPPCGGRLCWPSTVAVAAKHFYPRPPCGGRPGVRAAWCCGYLFLSTSPLRGTTSCEKSTVSMFAFLSTSPLRGTTASCSGQGLCRRYFYPRPPCGGRPWIARRRSGRTHFYPRPPCGGRRTAPTTDFLRQIISIHVPLAGDDRQRTVTTLADGTFLSTSPLRGTTLHLHHALP